MICRGVWGGYSGPESGHFFNPREGGSGGEREQVGRGPNVHGALLMIVKVDIFLFFLIMIHDKSRKFDYFLIARYEFWSLENSWHIFSLLYMIRLFNTQPE